MDDLQGGENSKAGGKTCKVTVKEWGYGNIYIFACILKCNDTLQVLKNGYKGRQGQGCKVDFSKYTF